MSVVWREAYAPQGLNQTTTCRFLLRFNRALNASVMSVRQRAMRHLRSWNSFLKVLSKNFRFVGHGVAFFEETAVPHNA